MGEKIAIPEDHPFRKRVEVKVYPIGDTGKWRVTWRNFVCGPEQEDFDTQDEANGFKAGLLELLFEEVDADWLAEQGVTFEEMTQNWAGLGN